MTAESRDQTVAPDSDMVGLGIRFDRTRVVLLDMGLPYEFNVEMAAEASGHWRDDLDLPDIGGPALVVTVLPNVDAGDDEDEFFTDEDRDVLSEAILISRVIASAQACSDTFTAAFAHPAEMLIPLDTYRSVALDAVPGLPLSLWVDFLVADEGGVTAGETIGLSDLWLYDIEIADSQIPAETVVRVLVDAAVMQYEQGPVFADGMTLESDVGDFQVSIAPSKYDADTDVVLLDPPVLANRAQRRAAARKKKRR